MEQSFIAKRKRTLWKVLMQRITVLHIKKGSGKLISRFLFYSYIGNCVPYAIKPSGGSHCGVRNYAAKATRRRRRIPRAGFFFIA